MFDKRTIIALSASMSILGIGIGVGVYFGLTMGKKPKGGERRFTSMESPLIYFSKDDALDITWYHRANRKIQYQEALTGSYMMVSADVILGTHAPSGKTNIPVIAYGGANSSDLSLDEWLDGILVKKKGVKLNMGHIDAIEPSLKLLRNKEDLIDQPVWINGIILKGPGSATTPLDNMGFIKLVHSTFPSCTFSVGWSTTCCNHGGINRTHVEEMAMAIKYVRQPVSITVPAALLKPSWSELKWFLGKSDRFTLTVTTPAGDDDDWQDTSLYDLLYVRNDYDKRTIFYDLPGPKFSQFKKLVKTAGSILHYFPLSTRDGLEITWAHAANSKADMKKALSGNDMMIEADILTDARGTAIMAHPPQTSSDNTFETWLTEITKTTKGMKLDFKATSAVEPCLQLLQKKKQEIEQPVWINADILQGPKGKAPAINAAEFLNLVKTVFPECTMSLGWTTGGDYSPSEEAYSQAMVAEMAETCKTLQQPVTFPVRAILVRRSWKSLTWLLNQSRGFSLTIWHSAADRIDVDDLVYIRKNSQIDRVYYDLPDDLMKQLKTKLNYENYNVRT
ncbi:protein FAM151A-like [Tubulanus polymorphus]|uniref:protein FAM151A-like n=1 Tax=Tubulanus polymorphus TaxID=672921 RepID=UPI003DA28962